MICQRCGLEGAIDIDTGSRCHAELMECIVLLRADRDEHASKATNFRNAWQADRADAVKYRELMAVRKRAGWKDGQPCACVFDWDGNEQLHECEWHREQREALEGE